MRNLTGFLRLRTDFTNGGGHLFRLGQVSQGLCFVRLTQLFAVGVGQRGDVRRHLFRPAEVGLAGAEDGFVGGGRWGNGGRGRRAGRRGGQADAVVEKVGCHVRGPVRVRRADGWFARRPPKLYPTRDTRAGYGCSDAVSTADPLSTPASRWSPRAEW